METKPQQNQETENKTLPGRTDEGDGDDSLSFTVEEKVSAAATAESKSEQNTNGSASSRDKSGAAEKDDGSGGRFVDNGGACSSGDPGPITRLQDAHDPSGKEKESFPSLFISHASINISGSNPDISESEKFKISCGIGKDGSGIGDGKSGCKTDLDNVGIPQRVVVHRVCSDSRIGEGEGFHSSRLAFYNPDGSFSSSLKALGLSVNSKSRSSSIKNKNKAKHGGGNYNTSERGQSSTSSSKKLGNNNGSQVPSGTSNNIKSSNEAGLNLGLESRGIVAGGGVESGGGGGRENGNRNGNGSAGKHIDILPVIEGSLSEPKTEHPSTSEGDETLTEDVVENVDDELLDEYDEQNENLNCQLDFDAAVTQLLLRPENSRSLYKDSATWTQEDDMPSPLSDLSPVASPRRKKERNVYRELERDTGSGTAASHSHNSLLEQYHQYLLEQQQHIQHPQVHRHSRGGSSSKSGGSGNHRSSHGHSSHNPKSSIVGIHQGNLKSHHHHPPLPPPPPPQHAECFTVSSQLLSREAKLYENVPATQGELETLEILLASGGSGDSNYPPSGGSGSGGGASNTTASTSNTSGTSGQSHTHKTSANHGTNLNSSNNNHHHRSHHHNSHLLHQGYVHNQHSHSATNLNSNTANSSEQLFSVSDFLGPGGGGLTVNNGNNGGPPSRTSWADSGRESLSFDGENNNSTGSTRNLLLIPPPPPPPINYLASTSSAVGGGHSGFETGGGTHGTSSMMHSSQHHHRSSKHSSSHHSQSHHSSHHHHHHHHHTHSQVQSSESPSHSHHHNTRRSRRERLVRQKHAINDETIFPSHHNGSDNNGGMLGTGLGDPGGMNTSFMAVPSPRRGILPGSIQASNFVTAAASPINLQRHPPASQIMLQENKKNGPLIPCESPYGIMAGGTGPVGPDDWSYPETFGDNFRRATNKSHLTNNILRSRSPQRGHGVIGDGGGRKGKNNSSFDYGELPSHQMFPKRHLLQSRQFSGHRGYAPGASGTMQSNGTNGFCPPTAFQPMQHRSFPAGVFSGTTPRSCSMGDLTSSAASVNGAPNGQGHHHSNHHNGKSPEALAISSNTAPVNGLQSSTVPLVTSLPLPPATSVTYEFSLAPVSGTLAPGWHLTAVQRGLATAVPLAAAVARRRLPRPRTTRPRFGFTDKNEARRAKWTIVITALALLAMSMLLVGITLRLAPLIDDLGSSSSGSVRNRISFRGDPLSRRASGDAIGTSEESASYCAIPSLNSKGKFRNNSSESGIDNGHNNLGQSEHNFLHSSAPGSGQNLSVSFVPHPIERKAFPGGSSIKRRDGEIPPSAFKREMSMTLSIPSREDSIRSHSSIKSYGSYSAAAAPITAVTLASLCSGGATIGESEAKPSTSGGKLIRYGSNPDVFSSRRAKWEKRENEILYQANSAKRLNSNSSTKSNIATFDQKSYENNEITGPTSFALRGGGGSSKSIGNSRERKLKQKIPQEQKQNEKVACAIQLGFSSLLIIAVCCIVIFLRVSSSGAVRKENENLWKSIQPPLNSQNSTTPQPSTNTQQVADNSNGSEDGNEDDDKSIASGQSLTRTDEIASSLRSSSLSNIFKVAEEGQKMSNNTETTHENSKISNTGDEVEESLEGKSGSNRSNNYSSSKLVLDNDSISGHSTKTNNSVRPKRSRPKNRLEESELSQHPQRTSNKIISILNGKVHAKNNENDEAISGGGRTKTRHLESSIFRFLKNTGGQALRERRILTEGSRKL